MSKHTERFIKAAFILSIAGVFSKVASFFFRIPLTYLVGDIGIGYYNTVYPVLTILTATGVVGVPNAVSKLIAEEVALGQEEKAHRTFKMALWFSILFGVVTSLMMFLGANAMIHLGGWSSNTYYVIIALSISPVFIMISGAIRGYFQGFQIMQPSAIGQILENIIKFMFGITAVNILLRTGSQIPVAVGGAAAGTSLGFIIASLYTIHTYYRKRKQGVLKVPKNITPLGKGEIVGNMKRILALTIPFSIVSAVFSYMNLIDSFTLYRGLGAMGYSDLEVTAISGHISKAISLINFPQTISLGITMSMVPAISQAVANQNHEEFNQKVNQGFKFAFMLTLPAAVGLFVLAYPIMELVYPNPEGYVYLQYLTGSLILVILGQTISGILQGISKPLLPLISLVMALSVKILMNILLIPTTLEAEGATLASIFYYGVFAVVNYIVLKKHVQFKLNRKDVIFKPILAAIFMLVVVYFCYQGFVNLMSSPLATTLTIGVGAMVYLMILLVTRGYTREELSLLPKHDRIIGYLEKKNYFR